MSFEGAIQVMEAWDKYRQVLSSPKQIMIPGNLFYGQIISLKNGPSDSWAPVGLQRYIRDNNWNAIDPRIRQ